MILFTLTKSFLPKDVISEFTSAIWVERYSAAGDVQLVTPAEPSMIKKLAKGTFLGLRGTREIMVIDTQSIENGLLTVTGQSLPKFLDERLAWFKNPDWGEEGESSLVREYTDTTSAGQLISSVVSQTVVTPTPFIGSFALVNLDWDKEKIPGLEMGAVTTTGTPRRLSIPIGPLYSGIQQLAQQYGVGIKLYLDSARFSTGYVLKFATYLGKDRTSGQDVNRLVRLSPKLDSLSDVKEITSISNYKNVIYVLYKNNLSIHYAIPSLPPPESFERRVLVVDAEDIFLFPENILPYREQQAQNAIMNHIYVQAVDGQIASQIGYKYGVDYALGDIIELEGFTGILSKARVTEYIRAQDKFGEREYPTLAVIDPLNLGTMPDVEPDPDPDPNPWDGDSVFDFDFEPEDYELEDEDEEFDFDPDFDADFNPNHELTPLDPDAAGYDPDATPSEPDPNPEPQPEFPPEDEPINPLHPGPHQRATTSFFPWIYNEEASEDEDNVNFHSYFEQEIKNPQFRPPYTDVIQSPETSHDFVLKLYAQMRLRMFYPDTTLHSFPHARSPEDFDGNVDSIFIFQVGDYENIIDKNDTRAIKSYQWYIEGGFIDIPEGAVPPLYGLPPGYILPTHAEVFETWEIYLDTPLEIDWPEDPDESITAYLRRQGYGDDVMTPADGRRWGRAGVGVGTPSSSMNLIEGNEFIFSYWWTYHAKQ